MFARILVTIVLGVGIAVGLLTLRQQELEIMHDMTKMHKKIDETRREIWDLKVKIAQESTPSELKAVLQKADMKMKPIVEPEGTVVGNDVRMVNGGKNENGG